MTYLNRSSCDIILFIKQNLCDKIISKQMVVWPLANYFTVMTNVSAGAGLILKVY
jgi:hypothetical protein